MKLNSNFDPSLEEIINLCAPLADWFSRNQETMAYFEMTHYGCLQFNNSHMVNEDVVALEKMANASLAWLETPKKLIISPEEKATNAAFAIAMVYEDEKEKISEEARNQYYIDVQGLLADETEEKSSGRGM